MEMKILIAIILGLIALGVLIYFLVMSNQVFDNIMEWLRNLL